MTNATDKHTSDEWLNAVIDEAVDPTEKPLPANLQERLIADGEDFLRRRSSTPANGFRKKRVYLLPWSVAFASLAVCAVLIVKTLQQPSTANDLVAALSDKTELTWAPLDAPGFENVSGFVKWDNATQKGYMQIEGIPENDPGSAQYQLWIVDPQRDKHPVDGGVFDITAGTNIIPIDSRLTILEPKAFAVTLEQPGGVVVSEGPLLFIAST